jgi:hypothetical protein
VKGGSANVSAKDLRYGERVFRESAPAPRISWICRE